MLPDPCVWTHTACRYGHGLCVGVECAADADRRPTWPAHYEWPRPLLSYLRCHAQLAAADEGAARCRRGPLRRPRIRIDPLLDADDLDVAAEGATPACGRANDLRSRRGSSPGGECLRSLTISGQSVRQNGVAACCGQMTYSPIPCEACALCMRDPVNHVPRRASVDWLAPSERVEYGLPRRTSRVAVHVSAHLALSIEERAQRVARECSRAASRPAAARLGPPRRGAGTARRAPSSRSRRAAQSKSQNLAMVHMSMGVSSQRHSPFLKKDFSTPLSLLARDNC